MASIAPDRGFARFFFEPVRGAPLVVCGLAVWLAGAGYCHGYQHLLSGTSGSWAGSLTWSAVAVLPWFALFEWSKQPRGSHAIARPAALLGVVAAIAAFSIAIEYLVDFCVGDTTDHLALLFMRRLPAIGVAILLIAVTRKAVLRQAPAPPLVELGAIANAIDWVEAADNYIEVHSLGKVTLRRMTMREAADTLERHGFVRIHRRFLVNRSRIRAVHLNGKRTVELDSGAQLPVGRAYEVNLGAAR